MKALVVLTFDLPDPEAIVEVLEKVDPPQLPHFSGTARIVVDPEASAVEQWLDGAL